MDADKSWQQDKTTDILPYSTILEDRSCSLHSAKSCHHLLSDGILPEHSALKSCKAFTLPDPRRRRLSNCSQGGAVYLHYRRKQKSFDISMLSRDSDELAYLSKERSPSPTDVLPKVENYCSYAVEEILVTERQYLQDLDDIITGYMQCIHRFDHIAKDTVETIFGNIRELYRFHRSFLSDLERCGEEPVPIAKCFVDRSGEFSIYAKYCTNYPQSCTSLTQTLRSPVVADAFRQEQLSLGHGLPIGSYLHKPVQRILKYHLLLQNLLKHFIDGGSGRDVLESALHCMTSCARHINEMKRSHEEAMKVQEIQSILYNFEGYLPDFGMVVLEDDLWIYSAKSFRHVYLFEKGVIICKKREDGAMSCKADIMCDNLMLIESIPKEPLSFQLIPYDYPKHTHTLLAKTLEQKREWCAEVKRRVLESYNVPIPDKTKELLLSLTGKSQSDEKFAKSPKSYGFRPHQTPDYIEKKRRKSQTQISSPGDTLPRMKTRVRKTIMESSSTALSIGLLTPPSNAQTTSRSAECIYSNTYQNTDNSLLHENGSPNTSHDAPMASQTDTLNATSSLERSKSLVLLSTYESPKESCFDDQSRRADHLAKLIQNKNGLEDGTWSPELLKLLRRRRRPSVKRAESYSFAVTKALTLPRRKGGETQTSADILESLTAESDGTQSQPIDALRRYSLSEQQLNPADSNRAPEYTDTCRKSKTETSVLLNKFNQLKEKTSNKLSDLLRRSPVSVQKEFSLDKRLESCEQKLPSGALDENANITRLAPVESIKEMVTDPGGCDRSSSQSCAQMIDSSIVNSDHGDYDRLKCHSPAEAAGDPLDRSTGVIDSRDNLADLDENGYENIDFGDYAVLREKEEPIYDTVACCANAHTSVIYPPEFGTTVEEDQTPPSLPPLPSFLLKKRIIQSMAGLDSVLSTLDSFSKESLSRDPTPDKELPKMVLNKLTKPPTDFWCALERYLETGLINDQPIARLQSVHCNNSKQRQSVVEMESSDSDRKADRSNLQLDTGNELHVNKNSRVYRLARKYSTRIKSTQRIQSLRGKAKSDDVDSDSTVRKGSRTRSRSLRSPTYSKRHQQHCSDVFDSEAESDYYQANSGTQQCDFDSGSDCNDIYERQTTAVLESFASDELRDSAIFSDCEDNGLTSPDYEQRTRSLPRHSESEIVDLRIRAADTAVARPVSMYILNRLEALRKSSACSRESSPGLEESRSICVKETPESDRQSQVIDGEKCGNRNLVWTVDRETIDGSAVNRQSICIESVKERVWRLSQSSLRSTPSCETINIGIGLVKHAKEKLNVK